MKSISNHRRGLHQLIAISFLFVSTTAFAGHPRVQDMVSVKRMAHSIERSATSLHQIAERRSHHGGYQARQALTILHELNKTAQHFHNSVERNRQSPRHTETDYRKLVRAERISQNYKYVLHGDRQVGVLFNVIKSQMRQLSFLYNQSTSNTFRYREAMGLAHQIDNKADHLHNAIENELSRYGHMSYDEREVVSSVHQISELAEHLHEGIERRNTSIQHTINEFKSLKYQFESTIRKLNWINVSSHLINDLYALANPINQLARIYGVSTVVTRSHGGGHGGYGNGGRRIIRRRSGGNPRRGGHSTFQLPR